MNSYFQQRERREKWYEDSYQFVVKKKIVCMEILSTIASLNSMQIFSSGVIIFSMEIIKAKQKFTSQALNMKFLLLWSLTIFSQRSSVVK